VTNRGPSTRMIACVYGRAFAPFVESVARDLCAAGALAGGDMRPLTLEAAMADHRRGADVHRLYVLPFDPPPTMSPAGIVRELFPRAEVVTSFPLQELCWDKIATQELLLERGLPIPDTLITSEPTEVRRFVREYRFVMLKERYTCGGQGHLVLWFDDEDLVGDGGSHRYKMELVPHGRRRLDSEHLTYPAPFYLQRLVADIGPRGVFPAQVLRAYIVDGQIAFWTERYRDRYSRPSDWIINIGLGAKYRFLHDTSEETKKVALRTAEVIGFRIGAVDLIRTGSDGPYVLEVDTDGYHMIMDRQFKYIPEYREFFNLDRYIAEALLFEPGAPPPRRRSA
jgi:glutathione synthase/RimK-type ligase-like ATP-grasp enzyme